MRTEMTALAFTRRAHQSYGFANDHAEYSFTIPHDMQTLIEFMGGAQAFESRLDYIFQPNTVQQDLGANGAGITSIMNIGNEPDFATPYEYHYLNKQAKSVRRSRELSNQ